MKKLTIMSAVIAVASLASCTAQSPKADLKSEVDSLSYSIGMGQTQGLIDNLTRQGLDTMYIAEFIKGINEGSNVTGKKEIARKMGAQIGMQIAQMVVPAINKDLFAGDSTQTISKNNFIAGFIAGITEKGQKMNMMEAQTYTQGAVESVREKAIEKQYGENKAAGEKFLAENKSKVGVKTTESGLQYKIITEGHGDIPAETDQVKVNYKGTLVDGTEFDSSYARNEPATFYVNRVVKGWTEALKMMPVGSKWEIYVPYDLAYGKNPQGAKIKPFSTLIFEVELVSIEKPKK